MPNLLHKHLFFSIFFIVSIYGGGQRGPLTRLLDYNCNSLDCIHQAYNQFYFCPHSCIIITSLSIDFEKETLKLDMTESISCNDLHLTLIAYSLRTYYLGIVSLVSSLLKLFAKKGYNFTKHHEVLFIPNIHTNIHMCKN